MTTIESPNATAAAAAPVVALSFTGGKDCMLALHLMAGTRHPLVPPLATTAAAPGTGTHIKPASASQQQQQQQQQQHQESSSKQPQAGPQHPPVSLLVTFAPEPPPGEPIGGSFRAHPIEVIRAQAAALQLPHIICEVGAPYLERYTSELRRLRADNGVTALVTGDIDDVAGGFMASACAAAGVELVTPLWQLPRQSVLRVLCDIGLTATISCVALPKFAAPAPAAAAEQTGGSSGAGGGGSGSDGAATGGGEENSKSEGAGSCGCHCAPMRPVPLGPPLFDAVGRLLGHQVTPALIDGPLAEAAALTGMDPAGEDGSFHTIVTACPLMGGRAVLLQGRPEVDRLTGYACMRWDRVEVAAGPANAAAAEQRLTKAAVGA